MNKYIKFISGKEYTLKDLFGGDTKIVIPDLQRDYCWGDKAYVNKNTNPQELVSGFLTNIIQLYKDSPIMPITLGLIYGYEQPYNNIQICDGQQRLTTLFLILGVVNMKSGGLFNHYIISEAEMKDDYEPHLQYAIRESTLYFLSDLCLNVFIKKDTQIKDIKISSWYFEEYNQDASIQSMISALNIINNIFEKKEIDYNEFGNYIINKLRVLYYDMGTRSRGEETYVVINTTGEPLSATENIKPILLGNLNAEDTKTYSNEWEEREEWFWKNRDDKENTSDNGMHTFFMWYWQIGLIQENRWEGDKKYPLNVRELFISEPRKIEDNEINEIKFDLDNYKKFKSLSNLHNYFNSLKKLIENIIQNEEIYKILSTIKPLQKIDENPHKNIWKWLRNVDLDVVLPLLHFVNKYNEEPNFNDKLYKFVRKIRKNYYDKRWNKNEENKISYRGKNYLDWRYFIQYINKLGLSELMDVNFDTSKISINKIPNINLNSLYSEDEKWKDISELSDIEKIEDNEYLMGDLTLLRMNSDDNCSVINTRWENLQKICNALDCNIKEDDYEFSNWFRLYCVVFDISNIGHISNCTWELEGCYFSEKKNNPFWIESKDIYDLLGHDDILSEIKKKVKEAVGQFIDKPNDHKELIKSWLVLKTIKATHNKKLLSYFNNRALSAYKTLGQNYIDKSYITFNWGNVLCGNSYSYGVLPARDNSNWNKEENLDSPLSSINYIGNYFDRKTTINNNDIKKYDNEIKLLIDKFKNI